jgi:hypothetical protein
MNLWEAFMALLREYQGRIIDAKGMLKISALHPACVSMLKVLLAIPTGNDRIMVMIAVIYIHHAATRVLAHAYTFRRILGATRDPLLISKAC